MWVVLAALVVVSAIGCDRAVFVKESSPMRMGPNVKGQVYHWVDHQWILSTNKVEFPEGTWVVPPSYVDEKAATDGK
jgi:hypothetical protein